MASRIWFRLFLFLATLAASAIHAAVPPDPACSSANTIFCSGFEEGNFSLWNDYDGNPAPWNSLIPEAGPLNQSGNHATLMRVPPGRGGTDLTKVLPTQQDKVYVRWYQKWEPGYDFSVANHGGGPHGGDRNLMGMSGNRPTGADFFSAWVEPFRNKLHMYVYYRGMYQDCANSQGECWGDHFPCTMDDGSNYCTKAAHRETRMPPDLQTNKWYCVEMMLDAGTPVTSDAAANGSLNLWIDNVEYGPFNNLWFRTTPNLKVSVVSLALFHHAEHPTAGTMFDNFVISKERVGCSNIVRPNPPTDLRVQ